MKFELTIVNIKEATYECLYGRGCDGICCREGRPLVYAEEIERIDANLEKFLPEMRPEARAVVQKRGYITQRRRLRERVMRNAQGWCIFFHNGCVLHKVGAAEGDKFRYKPAVCALFPIQMDQHDRWYVRQKGFKQEKWDLFCLDPESSNVPALDSLKEEIALAKRFTDEAASAEKVKLTCDQARSRQTQVQCAAVPVFDVILRTFCRRSSIPEGCQPLAGGRGAHHRLWSIQKVHPEGMTAPSTQREPVAAIAGIPPGCDTIGLSVPVVRCATTG